MGITIWYPHDLLVYMAFSFLGLVTMIAVWERMQVRSARLLKSCRYAICPTCRYPLQPDSEVHTCPECGSRYSNDELVKLWKRVYRWRWPYASDHVGLRETEQE